MQSYDVTLLSTATNTDLTTDVLETKAIAEYERDRKRAHKGHDIRKKVTSVSHHYNNPNHINLPAWKRVGSDEKERNVLSRLGRNTKEDMEDLEQWTEDAEPVQAEEDAVLDKENRPSSSVRLEDLVRPTAKVSRKNSRQLTARASSPGQDSNAFHTLSSALLPPLMDTVSGSDSSNNDIEGFFEFSSPGAEEWTVAALEDGCVRFATFEDVAPASFTTTVVVMPCIW